MPVRARVARLFAIGNLAVAIGLAMYFFWLPALLTIRNITQLRDPAGIPAFTYSWFESLAPRYERWAIERIASQQATKLSADDVVGTEWPLYGSVMFLSAAEALQQEWERGRRDSRAPNVTGRGAIDAAAALVADTGHATWVRKLWGPDYLRRENLFYRTLLLSGLSSYQRLTGNQQHETLLREQAVSLAAELNASTHGIVNDFPGQSYSVDVLFGYAAITRANRLLGISDTVTAQRAHRAFTGAAADAVTQLPGYSVNAQTGRATAPARGVGISNMLIFAPELWPDTSRVWYQRFQQHFRQRNALLAGYREFARGAPFPEWMVEVDAGPIVAGFGTGSSGFALGAARVHGLEAEAYALGTQAVAMAWPLPDGTLLTGRLLSNATDARYLTEAVLLFLFTRASAYPVTNGPRDVPAFVGLTLLAFAGAGALFVLFGARTLRSLNNAVIPAASLQLVLWAAAILIGVYLMLTSSNPFTGLLVLTIALLLPRVSIIKTKPQLPEPALEHAHAS